MREQYNLGVDLTTEQVRRGHGSRVALDWENADGDSRSSVACSFRPARSFARVRFNLVCKILARWWSSRQPICSMPSKRPLRTARNSSTSWWSGYWNQPEQTAEIFRGEWYVSGDVLHRDDDGFFWFQGRADDLIKASGDRISPIEVESCLCSHPRRAGRRRRTESRPTPRHGRQSLRRAADKCGGDGLAG